MQAASDIINTTEELSIRRYGTSLRLLIMSKDWQNLSLGAYSSSQLRYPTQSESPLRFIEEPTAPDDILGHAAIRKALKPHNIGVATGEHAHNRMIFKQLLQAEAIDVCQIDACRLAGVSEVLGVLLMATKCVKGHRHSNGH
jgi:hypothetical protein